MPKKFISLLFILTLLAPAMLWLSMEPTTRSRREPALQAFPRPEGRTVFKNDYYRALDRYINDHFIFRERMVFIKNWLDLKLFRKTARADIHVGRDGWFYRRGDIENLIQDGCDDAGPINRLLLDLHALEKMIEASGRRFRFLVVPSKASIYPEYVGWVPLPARGRCSAYDLFREAQRAHPLTYGVPLEAPLFARKVGSQLLYDPTAGYWNGRGAAVAAEALHQSFFNTGRPSPVMAAEGRPDDLERQVLGVSTASPTAMLRRLAGSHTEGMGHSLVYGDAAIEPLLPHLLPMGRRLDVISAESIPSKRIEEDLRSFDSILIQTTESGIQDLRIDLERVFDMLIHEAASTTHAPVSLKSVKSIANTALHPRLEGLEVKSLGARSTFAIIDLPGSYRRCFRVLRLNLSALQPDTMTVTYQTDPPIRVKKTLRPARFNLYFPLPVKSNVTLRLQPGSQAGLLVLHEAEIIGFPEGEAAACGRPPRGDQTDIVMVDTSAPSIEDAKKTDERPADAGHARNLSTVPEPPPARMAAAERPRPGDAKGVKPLANREPLKTASANREASAAGMGSDAGLSVDSDVSTVVIAKENVLPANTPETDKVLEAVLSVEKNPTVTLNDFADGRIFQRQDRQTDIIVSGVFRGTVSGIEARVIRHGSTDAVVPWTLIDDAPGNGIFLGLLPGVPEGGWYALQVRATNEHSVRSNGTNRWGVGILMACIGQSNMKEWFASGSDLEAHPLLRRYAEGGWHTLDGRGNGAIACGNRIISRTGLPVGLIDYAVNGSGLHRKADWGTGYWEDTRPDSIYRGFLAGVAATGGRLEFVLWIQGEADAARGTVTTADYQAALSRFISRQVRRDITNGSSQPQLPFLVVAMVKRPAGQNDPHQAIREAQRAITEQMPECYLAATTLDLENRGKQHLAPAAYTTMGRRVAQTVLYILGIENYHRGPMVAAVRHHGERALDVTLRHHGGTDILPESGITGWEVIDAEGVAPIQNVFRQGPQTIRILLERALQERAEVRYLYGAKPDARRPLRDNASLSLPLEAFRGGVAPSSAPPRKTGPGAIPPP